MSLLPSAAVTRRTVLAVVLLLLAAGLGRPDPAAAQGTTLAAVDDEILADGTDPAVFEVLANDIATGGTIDPASISFVAGSGGIDVTFDGDGVATITPTGSLSFSNTWGYRVCLQAPNDGVCDTATISYLPDRDGDGIHDIFDSVLQSTGSFDAGADADEDGTENYLDTDSDDDGIPDAVEGTADVDGDGDGNWIDLDSDGDTFLDQDEGTTDSDGDGTPDYLDWIPNYEATGKYAMLEADGDVHLFWRDGGYRKFSVPVPPGETAVSIAFARNGVISGGIFVLTSDGTVWTNTYYDTTGWLTEDSGHNLFIPPLLPGEQLSSLASTGSHYCCIAAFTNRGRALGSLAGLEDLVELGVAQVLNGDVLAAEPTPNNGGAWLVASDGGIFALGDAQFAGSMGGLPLNQPVVGMAPDPDGNGYWLVASDGGIFAFNAQFRGSIPGILAPGQTLNQPVVGAVPWGNGYLMVAADGGIFSFSDAPFFGSLGTNPPNSPVIDIAAWWQSEP